MAEMQPFTINAVATLRIGDTEVTKTIPLQIPVKADFISMTGKVEVSADVNRLHWGIRDLTEWFAECPDGTERD